MLSVVGTNTVGSKHLLIPKVATAILRGRCVERRVNHNLQLCSCHLLLAKIIVLCQGPVQAYVRTSDTELAARIISCPKVNGFHDFSEYSLAIFVKSCCNPYWRYEISADQGFGTSNGFLIQINCKILLVKSNQYRECLKDHVQAAGLLGSQNCCGA